MPVFALYRHPDRRTRITTHQAYRAKQASAKGGLVAAARQTSHRWTPEEARQAAVKSHRHTGPRTSRSKRRSARARWTDLTTLRAAYAPAVAPGRVRYYADRKQWRLACPCWTLSRPISEAQALRYIGHYAWPATRSPIVGAPLVRLMHGRVKRGHVVEQPDGTKVVQW